MSLYRDITDPALTRRGRLSVLAAYTAWLEVRT